LSAAFNTVRLGVAQFSTEVNALASSGITSNNQTVIILTVGNNAAQSTAVDVARERGSDAALRRHRHRQLTRLAEAMGLDI
jgi:hypothetical protein